VLAVTAIAAPIMLGVPNLSDPVALTDAFDRFTFWGLQIRGAFWAVVFLAGVGALAVLPPDRSRSERLEA
jgi:hypothetical protein